MAEKDDKVRRRSLANKTNYQQTFESHHGKRVLYDLMKKSGMMTTSFVEKDSHGTAFNEGQRSIVLSILNVLKIDLVKLERTMQEGHEHDQELWD